MTKSVGLIGGGNITETHARAARAISGVDISAIYGTNIANVERLCREYGGVFKTFKRSLRTVQWTW